MSKSPRSVAINYLARREHSIGEIRTKLMEKGFTIEDIEPVIERLLAENLLSEERYAESYCRTRSSKGFGPVAIRHELQMKNIDDFIIEKALSSLDIDWTAQLQQVFDKKFSSANHLDLKEKAKCWRYLSYKGYTSDQINSILNLK